MKHILCLIFLCSCGPNKEQANNQTLLFVLAGQSNLSGSWQKNSGALPSNNVTEIHRNPDWSFSAENNYAYPNYGPSTNIARQLELKYPGRKIKILNAAAGGSVMSDWRQNQTGGLYLPMIAEINKAVLLGAKLEAFLWYQGEADAGTLEGYANSSTWANLFSDLLGSLKKDLGRSDFKIVFAQIATTTNQTLSNWATVKTQQDLAAELLNIPIIRTDDLTLCDDVHLDQSQLDKLAERFVNKL